VIIKLKSHQEAGTNLYVSPGLSQLITSMSNVEGTVELPILNTSAYFAQYGTINVSVAGSYVAVVSPFIILLTSLSKSFVR
jgi:hypothetical protein